MKSNKALTYALICAAAFCTQQAAASPRQVSLSGDSLTLVWKNDRRGYTLASVEAFGIKADAPGAAGLVLYNAERPSDDALAPAEYGGEETFPGDEYRYIVPSWREATSAVALNRAGSELRYKPSKAVRNDDGSVTLSYSGKDFDIAEVWRLDGKDVAVSISLTAHRDGWYSISSPSVLAVEPCKLDFAIIPGVLHGNAISSDFCRSYAYGWGIPALPVVYRERSTSTLTSIVSSTDGITLAVTAEPGTAAEPWGDDSRNKGAWRLGLSAMNRKGELSPTLYHPVLGHDDSYMTAGESRSFSFRLTFGNRGWWPVFKHVAYDIYSFGDTLPLRENHRSLTDRLYGIHRYVVNDSTSRWHTVEFEGDTIGAQEYLGGVYMAKRDAMKNADYGAMWMLGAMTADSLLTVNRLPYALNFKLRQHNDSAGFMHGASRGQYYLRDSRRFVEEWGPYTEPIATTYYMLMDLGNIALFEPDNSTVKELIRSSADWLLRTQKADGSWAVAYSDADNSEAFADLKDLRPTFYGLLIAYRILGEKKYLDGACRGADWLMANAVEPQHWLGVCGDTRFAPDFATAQAAQALMELSDATADSRYMDAAIASARFYTTSVYTNPVASARPVTVKGKPLQQWQITTAGLSYEHGGIFGSANLHGPILLASHAGMFVRMFAITGERIFLDMARAAAIGRDAFVDDTTAVASYYWATMNNGAGPYPHHAWWQMGWITDYLLAELELRSDGAIHFPAGFITPKVGPHRTSAFRPGSVYGEEASLVMIPDAVKTDNPNIESVLAQNSSTLFVMLLNDLASGQNTTVDIAGHGRKDRRGAPYGREIIKI
ncbi:MAG: glycerophosphoryl diester phosphodiesterase, partial [Muribaculaceae bacterium]|nr:glycerophosphoryl diester phosphodiesterase [Muribaculaceae bacterium]